MSYNKKTNMYEGYIYLITNNINGKKYIGQTIRKLSRRWYEHTHPNYQSKKSHNYSLLSKAILKYGVENFTIVEIEKVISQNKKDLKTRLDELEIYYINFYDTLVKNNKGYNVTKGGNSPSVYDEKPVVQYGRDKKIIKIYESITQASIETGVSIADISHCCHKERGVFVGGYMWSFLGDTYNTEKNYKFKKIKKYDLDKNLIAEYENVFEVSDDKKIRNKIRNCCTGYRLNVDGYVYRYEDDPIDKYPYKPKDYEILNLTQICKYSIDGDLLETFENYHSIQGYNGQRKRSIIHVCEGDKKVFDGFVWRFYRDSFDKYDIGNYRGSKSA